MVMKFRTWLGLKLYEGPQGWVGTWMCILLAVFAILCAGFGVSRWYEFVSANWAVFPALFAVSLSGQLWNKKNKMRYAPELYVKEAEKHAT
jgi:Na+/proline symporter